MLSDLSQTQKDKHCMSPHIQRFLEELDSQRQKDGGDQVQDREGEWGGVSWGQSFCLQNGKVLEISY